MALDTRTKERPSGRSTELLRAGSPSLNARTMLSSATTESILLIHGPSDFGA
jgi:hypothetical protein